MRYILIYMLATVVAMPLFAQQEDISKQVEVTKNYAPQVQNATKLTPEPRMVDTVKLRPQGEYRIAPQPWVTSFGVNSFAPIKFNALTAKQLDPFYLKVGAGYPLNSVLDFYGWSNGSKGSFGGYINHKGDYEKLTNELDRKVSATQSSNSVGVIGERFVGSRMSVKGEIGYDYDFLTRYGDFLLPEYPLTSFEPADPSRLSYTTARLAAEFGNDFKDLSRFNFRLGVSGYTFADRNDMVENNIALSAEIGKMFNIHKITLKTSFDGYFGDKDLHYYDRIITIAPRYEIEMDRFKFRIGGDYVYDMQNGDNKSYFFPNFRVTFDVTSGYFVPFVEEEGVLINNGYRSTVSQNPYVQPGLVMKNCAEYRGRAGIMGSFASSFSYKAYAGVTIFRGINNFASLYSEQSTSEFVYFNDKGTLFTVGGDLTGRISGSFMLSASAHYYGYSLKNSEKVSSRPSLDATLDVRYNYGDKFSVSLGGKFVGNTYYYDLVPEAIAENPSDVLLIVKSSPTVDLHLVADYRLSKMLTIFAEGNNLLNAELYPYNHYKGFGISCTAGVKLTF